MFQSEQAIRPDHIAFPTARGHQQSLQWTTTSLDRHTFWLITTLHYILGRSIARQPSSAPCHLERVDCTVETETANMDNDNPNPRDRTQSTVASRPTRCNRTLKTIVILFLCLGYMFSIVAWNKQLIAPTIQQDSVWSYSSKSAHPLDYVEPIRYIAVAGLYHSGTSVRQSKLNIIQWISSLFLSRAQISHFISFNSMFVIFQNMWHTINNNTFVAKSKGINLDAFKGGYPPCGVPFLPNFTVDTSQIFGDSSGITDQNVELSANWGVMVRTKLIDTGRPIFLFIS